MEFIADGMEVQLQEHSGLKRWFTGSTVLKIAEAGGKGFRITPQYGFAAADLKQFYSWLKES